jgi:hypothetical protein
MSNDASFSDSCCDCTVVDTVIFNDGPIPSTEVQQAKTKIPIGHMLVGSFLYLLPLLWSIARQENNKLSSPSANGKPVTAI